MNYMKITKYDTANGFGIRDVLWVSGCEHHCPECHNQETWDCSAGKEFTEDTLKEILKDMDAPFRKGITFSGGDPLHPNNRETVTEVARRVREAHPEKSIWCYTGYRYDDVKELDIMKYLDVLVDGRFIIAQKDMTLPYCGSKNQRVIDVPKTRETGNIVLWWTPQTVTN